MTVVKVRDDTRGEIWDDRWVEFGIFGVGFFSLLFGEM